MSVMEATIGSYTEDGDEFEAELTESIVAEPEAEVEGEEAIEAAPESEDEGEAVEASPEAEEEEEVAPEPVRDSRIEALLRDLEEKDRALSRKVEDFDRLVQSKTKVEEEVPSQPPIDPNQIKSMDEWLAFDNWRQARLSYVNKQTARAEAEAAFSEQTLRGMLNEDAVGKQWAYDSAIQKYVAPVLKDSPALNGFIQQMRDPAKAKMSLALMLALGEKNGSNFTKTVKDFAAFIEGRGEATELVEKINKAKKSGAAKVGQRASKGGSKPAREPTAEEIEAMSEEQYRAYRAKRGNPL